jgi:hypothetical protein
LAAALRSGDARPTGSRRELLALRGKARLDAKQLQRLNSLIDQIGALLSEDRRRGRGDRVYALTVVLTPARDASVGSGGPSSRRTRKSP